MFDAVSDTLSSGGCIGLFPEGGSHDRSDLLPLKAGVAIVALGHHARNPKSELSIIPCGMNYFHAHKFRSLAVNEFGDPIQIHHDQTDAYKAGSTERRSAVGSLVETIYMVDTTHHQCHGGSMPECKFQIAFPFGFSRSLSSHS